MQELNSAKPAPGVLNRFIILDRIRDIKQKNADMNGIDIVDDIYQYLISDAPISSHTKQKLCPIIIETGIFYDKAFSPRDRRRKHCPLFHWSRSYGWNDAFIFLIRLSGWKHSSSLKSEWRRKRSETRFDDVGNLYGRLAAHNFEQVILSGSHIDTHVNGGNLTGNSAALCRPLAPRSQSDLFTPLRTVEVVNG